jgi:hypothetical protein
MIGSFVAFVGLASFQVPTSPFVEAVNHSFDIWDANHDGILTQVEIDHAALNPEFHGKDAAALAALDTWLATSKDPAPFLTKDWFGNYKSVRLRIPPKTPALEAKKTRKAYSASPESLEFSFSRSLNLLKKLKRSDLYDGSGPDLSDIRQGRLGDCFLLAPLGAMVHRDPNQVKQMVTVKSDGYQVQFGDGKKVDVAPLTDSELAMGGSATTDGLWIRVLEKAYGARRIKEGTIGVSQDNMNGGSVSVSSKALTGTGYRGIKLIGNYLTEVADSALDPLLEQVRKEILLAIEQKLLVTATTPNREMPKSISMNHAYAVFDYDPSTDKITIWNPHGDNFKPKGPEGMEFGYAKRDGIFAMPLKDFARTFGRIMFEVKK